LTAARGACNVIDDAPTIAPTREDPMPGRLNTADVDEDFLDDEPWPEEGVFLGDPEDEDAAHAWYPDWDPAN
jgi:hypothetical protein